MNWFKAQNKHGVNTWWASGSVKDLACFKEIRLRDKEEEDSGVLWPPNVCASSHSNTHTHICIYTFKKSIRKQGENIVLGIIIYYFLIFSNYTWSARSEISYQPSPPGLTWFPRWEWFIVNANMEGIIHVHWQLQHPMGRPLLLLWQEMTKGWSTGTLGKSGVSIFSLMRSQGFYLQRQDFLRSLPSFCFTSLLFLYYFSHHFFSPSSGSCTNLCFLDFPNSCLFGDIFLSHDQLSRWVVFIFLLILFLSASVRLLNMNRYLLKTLNPKLGLLHARFLFIGHSSPTVIYSEGVNW